MTKGTHSLFWRVFKPQGGVTEENNISPEDLFKSPDAVGPKEPFILDASYIVMIRGGYKPSVVPSHTPVAVNDEFQVKLGTALLFSVVDDNAELLEEADQLQKKILRALREKKG